MPKFLAQVINNAADRTPWFSVGIAGMMILTAVLMMAGGVGGAYYGGKASVNFAADLRDDVFGKVQRFSFANIDRFSTGSLVTRLTNDINQLQVFVNMLLRLCLRAPGMMVGGLIMAIALNPSLSVVFAVTIPLMLVSIGVVIAIGFPRFTRLQSRIDALNANVQENITNVRVVKSFVRESHEIKKFRTSNRNLKEAHFSAMKVVIFMMPIMTLFMNVTVLAVLWFGGNIVIDGNMKIGDLSAFITYVTQILSSLMMVTMLLMIASRAMASARRVCEVLDETLDLSDEKALFPHLEIKEGKIEFRDVSFRYFKSSEEKVLDSINLEIAPGSTVGIIGSTGCGKTTLVSMISRLYDTDEGQVLIDGVDVKDYSLFNLREGIGMVLQKNVLFTGTIEDNLRWGDSDATDEEIRAAAEHAQAHKFISSFKDGYGTDLDKGGANVSGGQKQRLCIARALLKRPKILILDDSTSAVDTATEAQIRASFETDLRGVTKIIIAQRISSVMSADKVVVMNEGRITGVGTHQELLKSNEAYREIYESQTDISADGKGGANA